MRQIIQRLKSNDGVELADFPAPLNKDGHVLIRTRLSLVSKGTESMLVKFGNSGYIEKAKQKPDRVKQVIEKIKTNGLIHTVNTVKNKLDQTIALGYCNCGVVIDSKVDGINEGDRVISNGPHAEIVRVPGNLIAKIPEEVSDDQAVFTVIGSIGLQGIRLCNPTFGETIVVIGLGLVGLLTVQLLKANGAKVIGIDIDQNKCDLAQSYGVTTINSINNDPVKDILRISKGVGADGVIITASTKKDNILSQAANMSRKRGRIILVGVVDLSLNRNEFYEKELNFQVSCSYGPGRYDSNYEEMGIDYPLPFVRWTEKRNFETILNSISTGQINLSSLITEKVSLVDFKKIYDSIDSNDSIASIIEYPDYKDDLLSSKINLRTTINDHQKPVIGLIGAGNFTKASLLPNLIKSNTRLRAIASSQGVNATLLAEKFNFEYSTSDFKSILNDDELNVVFVTTRHDSHAYLIIELLNAGKNVFVEKPLCIKEEELEQIIDAYNANETSSLIIGYNRRFSPHVKKIKESMGENFGPINMILNMNAGYVPDDHWVNNKNIGGGRIIGEACHLIDLCIFFAGSMVESVCMNNIIEKKSDVINNGSILLKFLNGSNASINYFTNGSNSYPKERIEIYSNGMTWVSDNYRLTKGYGVRGFKDYKTRIDKGHNNLIVEYIDSIMNGNGPLINTDQIINTSLTTFGAIESLKKKTWVKIDP